MAVRGRAAEDAGCGGRSKSPVGEKCFYWGSGRSWGAKKKKGGVRGERIPTRERGAEKTYKWGGVLPKLGGGKRPGGKETGARDATG